MDNFWNKMQEEEGGRTKKFFGKKFKTGKASIHDIYDQLYQESREGIDKNLQSI